MRYKNSTSPATTGHKWHVHTTPPSKSASDCVACGGHYDPSNVEVAGYTCDPSSPASCYAGDMSGKFGAASVGGASTSGIDSVLTMSGLIGRSVVVHAANSGSPRVA